MSDGSTWKRMIYWRGKASYGEDVQYIEYSNQSTTGKGIVEEIGCPDMTGELSCSWIKGLRGYIVFFSGSSGRFLKINSTIESIYLFMIYHYTLGSKFSPYHSITSGRMIKGNVFDSIDQISIIFGAFIIKGSLRDIKSIAKHPQGDIKESMGFLDKQFYLLPAQMFF